MNEYIQRCFPSNVDKHISDSINSVRMSVRVLCWQDEQSVKTNILFAMKYISADGLKIFIDPGFRWVYYCYALSMELFIAAIYPLTDSSHSLTLSLSLCFEFCVRPCYTSHTGPSLALFVIVRTFSRFAECANMLNYSLMNQINQITRTFESMLVECSFKVELFYVFRQ